VREVIDKTRLTDLILASGLAASAARVEKLAAYLELLEVHGRRLGLGAGAIGEGVWPHLVKSVALAGGMFHVEHSERSAWLDVGSGGGVPALPIKILVGGSHLTMIEPRRKRQLFLEEAVRLLGLAGVSIERARWQDYLVGKEGQFNWVTAQGIGGLAATLKSVSTYLTPGGKFICWRGTDLEKELTRCGKLICRDSLSVRKVEEIEFAGKQWATMLIVEKMGMKSEE